jgi:hypothetical protein
MLPYFLSETLAARYRFYNERYGTALFLALILLSVAGLPIFSSVIALAQRLMNAIIIF